MTALIPARAGSRRIPGKNVRLFFGHPLIAYAIHAARQSGVFDHVLVCSDNRDLSQIAHVYGASFFARRPSAEAEADIVWIRDVIERGALFRSFAILRPSSPFRTTETIRRAYHRFTASDSTSDSLRAVELVTQHPSKMWQWDGPGYPMTPLLSGTRSDGVPWHSCPAQTLPTVYVQNACLEMAYTANVEVYGTIHGRKVIPFLTTGYEGHDLNTERDWREAEYLVSSGAVVLPDPTPALAAAPEAQRPPDSCWSVAGRGRPGGDLLDPVGAAASTGTWD